MNPPVGHCVAPLQSLTVEVSIVGEAHARPHVAPDVLDAAFDLPLGLGPVGTAQPHLEIHPHGEVQHPLVPHRLLVLVPSQGHHLGIIVEAAAQHVAQVLEGIHVALDECGGVRPAHQFHVAGPGPAQGHHEHPDATLLPVLVKVGQAAPVHLGLFPGRSLETQRGIGLPASPARRHVGLQDAIATVIAQGLELPVQHHAVFQPLGHPPVNVLGVSVQLRPPGRPVFRPHGLRRLQVSPHRISSDVQFPGDTPNGATRSFHLVDLFHLSHLQQSLSSTSTKTS